MAHDNEQLLENAELPDGVDAVNPTTNQHQPKDRFRITYFLFFLVGLSQLLPWNFLVTATDYWMYKFRDPNNTSNSLVSENENKSHLQTFFDSYLAIASNIPFLLVFFVSFNERFKRISNIVKNSIAFISVIIVLAIITSFVLINTDQFQSTFLLLVLFLVFILNLAAGTLQANFAGIASLFPAKCMHLMVTGQATSGLFAAIAQILALIGNWSIMQSTFVYFLFADLIVLGTFSIYLIVQKTNFYRFYHSVATVIDQDSVTNETMNMEASVKVFKKMWPFCVTLMLVFWATIAVFPGVVVLVVPQSDQFFISHKLFLPICCFLTFNLSDFLGRYIGRYFLFAKEKGRSLVFIALARIVFVPMLMFCNTFPRHLPVFFASEIYFVLYLAIFGLLNGYLILNVFVNGPLSVPPEHRQTSGYFLIFFLGLGLTLGSLTSPLLVGVL